MPEAADEALLRDLPRFYISAPGSPGSGPGGKAALSARDSLELGRAEAEPGVRGARWWVTGQSCSEPRSVKHRAAAYLGKTDVSLRYKKSGDFIIRADCFRTLREGTRKKNAFTKCKRVKRATPNVLVYLAI